MTISNKSISFKSILESYWARRYDKLVYTSEDINELNFNELFIYNVLAYHDSTRKFLARIQLIPNKMNCDKCQEEWSMRFAKRSSSCDGFIWTRMRPCTSSKAIKSNTIVVDEASPHFISL